MTSAGDTDAIDDADKFDANGYRKGSLMAATAAYGRVPYGEESRKYRRTVFDYDDWVSHRNGEKIVTNIKGMFFSGVIRQLKEEVLFVTTVAACVVLWNDFLIFPDEFLNGFTLPKVVLPALPFTLSSPALGLLLVFKTNASYARWSEARTTWAKVVAQSRNMVRMASTFVTGEEGDREKIQDLSNAVWLLSRSTMNSLLGGFEDEEDYREQVMSVYSGSVKDRLIAQKIVDSGDRTMAALAHASTALDNVPIDEKRRVEIDKSLVIMGDCIGVCEKIYTSPVPLVYTRHTGRFLSLWMLLLPTAMYDAFADKTSVAASLGNFQCLALIPATAIVGLFLFGIEELAMQLEEPFSILPMQKFCDDVRRSTKTISEWSFDEKCEEKDLM